MSLVNEKWAVRGCGNEAHGPQWTCWKVVDARGAVMLKGVDKAQAERYAALPGLTRALRKMLHAGHRRNSDVVEFHTPACWDGIYAYLKTGADHGHADCAEAHAALAAAGERLP